MAIETIGAGSLVTNVYTRMAIVSRDVERVSKQPRICNEQSTTHSRKHRLCASLLFHYACGKGFTDTKEERKE